MDQPFQFQPSIHQSGFVALYRYTIENKEKKLKELASTSRRGLSPSRMFPPRKQQQNSVNKRNEKRKGQNQTRKSGKK